jgi:hypothetical protein
MAGIPADSGWQALRRGKRPGLRQQRVFCPTPKRYPPYVFIEQGVAMLSSVLNSPRAIQVNIQIIRTFTKLCEMIAGYLDLRQQIKEMEKKYNSRFKVVFDAIKY